MTEEKPIKTFLFIGDPHASSKRVFRRKDNYAQDTLEKLKACASYSHAHCSQTFITGDLFHSSGENNIRFLNQLIAVLKSFYTKVILLDGNHDRFGPVLQDEDSLQLLVQTGVILLRNNLQADLFDMQGQCIQVNYAQHGIPLPTEIPLKSPEVDYCILMTHHDLAMGSSYPGSLPLKPIQGVDMVINGHMHDTKKPQRCGTTVYQNPGNIQPLTVDLIEFIPHAWLFDMNSLTTHALTSLNLPHSRDCFDLTGIRVKADKSEGVAQQAVTDLIDSYSNEDPLVVDREVALTPGRFATSLKSALEAGKTTDASILEEDLAETLILSQQPQPVIDLFSFMLEQMKKQLDSTSSP